MLQVSNLGPMLELGRGIAIYVRPDADEKGKYRMTLVPDAIDGEKADDPKARVLRKPVTIGPATLDELDAITPAAFEVFAGEHRKAADIFAEHAAEMARETAAAKEAAASKNKKTGGKKEDKKETPKMETGSLFDGVTPSDEAQAALDARKTIEKAEENAELALS